MCKSLLIDNVDKNIQRAQRIRKKTHTRTHGRRDPSLWLYIVPSRPGSSFLRNSAPPTHANQKGKKKEQTRSEEQKRSSAVALHEEASGGQHDFPGRLPGLAFVVAAWCVLWRAQCPVRATRGRATQGLAEDQNGPSAFRTSYTPLPPGGKSKPLLASSSGKGCPCSNYVAAEMQCIQLEEEGEGR